MNAKNNAQSSSATASANVPSVTTITTSPAATQTKSVQTSTTMGVNIPLPSNVITASGILLAFVVAFYTLIARERKSPYLINSAVWILLICMLGAFFASVGAIAVDPWGQYSILIASSFLIVAISLTILKVYRLAIRMSYFVDTANPKHLRIFRKIKQGYRLLFDKKIYEHNSVGFSDEVIIGMLQTITPFDLKVDEPDKRKEIHQAAEKDVRSIAIRLDHHSQTNQNLAKLVEFCLEKEYLIQYMTASRHPLEFLSSLKEHCEIKGKGAQWAAFAKLIVVIDAYTPHFGFTDSVYQQATKKIKGFGVHYLASTETYAGLHTAASTAFNAIKDQQKSNVRKPSIIIYEDCYALTDLESIEQYRIFLRHVIPSERLWEGMFTVFTETVQAENDWTLLKSYADAVFDLRNSIK